MSDTIVICPRTGNRCTNSGCAATDVCFLGDPMGGSMNPGRTMVPQHYVPQERLAEVERAARAAERDSISMELALIPNAYRRPDMAHAYSRGVNDCRERIVDRGLRARAEGGA